jgi:glycosyltransferase involved in cell wall biosynthesis
MSPREAQELRDALRETTETLSAIQQTVSWRVTRPLRAVRRRARSGAGRHERTRRSERHERVVATRLDAATRLLAADGPPGDEATEPRALDSVLDHLCDVLGSFGGSLDSAAWLLLTAVDGSYPAQRDVEHSTQVLRTSGPAPFVGALRRRIADPGPDAGSSAGFEVVEGAVVVDVSQIASSDLHTGIQRVARECVSHWLRGGLPIRLSSFDRDAGVLRLLADEESERLRRWQDHLGGEERIGTRVPRASDAILVPWDCDLVLAELPTPQHSAAARGLAQSRVHRSLSLVCYDLIPFVAPESVDPRIVTTFAEYLALLKHGDRVSAISAQTAADLRAFSSMLSGQGLRGPQIEAHPLPTEVPPVDRAAAEPSSKRRSEPLVLVVGVHAPRKNHVAVLEAAERLWQQGRRFELLFMGGSTWRAEGYFDAYVDRLRRAGRPLTVERRVSEAALWDAYRRARFTVFPSLIEGFGLPVAESLAVGTPAITSGFGSMAEIAAGGGALTVDPRDVGDLEAQMRRLLDDDELLGHLRAAARSRDMGTWSAYADSVWKFFFPDAEPS